MANQPAQPSSNAQQSSIQASQSQSLGRVAAPARVLNTLLNQALTGRLQVSDLMTPSLPSWSLYVAQGQVQFVTGKDPRGDRLAYLLQRSCRQIYPARRKQLRKAAQNPYGYLYHCWKAEQISLQELRGLLRSASQEALVQVLSMTQGRVKFDQGVTPSPTLISLDLSELIAPLDAQIEQWRSLQSKGVAPHSCLSLVRSRRFAAQFGGPLQAIRRAQGALDLQALLSGQPSLYAIAARLNADLLTVAQMMDQAVSLGYLRWQSKPTVPPKTSQGSIACLDSSDAVQQTVRQILKPLGYQVIGISHPQQALSILVKERPCLILMDGTLAAEEDQSLGRLLRESSLLQHIPLLLMTAHDSLVNPIRAKAAGAKGWVVKPLETANLIKAVQRWAIQSSTSQPPSTQISSTKRSNKRSSPKYPSPKALPCKAHAPKPLPPKTLPFLKPPSQTA